MTSGLIRKKILPQDVQVGDLLWYEPTISTRLLLVLSVDYVVNGDKRFNCLVLAWLGLPLRREPAAYIDQLALGNGPIYIYVYGDE